MDESDQVVFQDGDDLFKNFELSVWKVSRVR